MTEPKHWGLLGMRRRSDLRDLPVCPHMSGGQGVSSARAKRARAAQRQKQHQPLTVQTVYYFVKRSTTPTFPSPPIRLMGLEHDRSEDEPPVYCVYSLVSHKRRID
jgi:hypothetical protein